MPLKRTTTPMTDATIKALIAQGVATALAEYEANRSSKNGDDSHDSGRVVGLTQWFKKMKFIFHISNCIVACQIKFATCTLQGNALTWWNSHVKTASHEESDEVKKYVGGLFNMIQGCVMASKPKTMQDAIEIANDLTNLKIYTFVERQAENKRKLIMTTKLNNNIPRSKIWQGPILWGLVRRRSMLGLYRYATSASFIITAHALNQVGGTEARGMVYDLGGGETDQDIDNMEDDINA
nr:hypothetical protein [Tanacetum cinerariifolium]